MLAINLLRFKKMYSESFCLFVYMPELFKRLRRYWGRLLLERKKKTQCWFSLVHLYFFK